MSETNHMPAARPCTVILRGLEGEFTEEVLVFGAGFSVGPFSVGQQGDWRVRANGVASVHVYLWFDGLTLHAARLLGGPEAWLNGEPLREDWSPLPGGSELRVGAAKVVISTEDNLVPVSPTAAAPEATEASPLSPAEPSQGARAPSRIERLGLTRRGTITWRVLLLACGVPAVVLVWLAMTGSSQPGHKPVPTPSARSSTTKLGSLTAPAQTSATSASNPAPAVAPEDALAAAESARLLEAAPADPDIQKLEHQAADAVLRGDFQAAADIYGNLLTLVPSSRAFAVAKRVATRKAGLAASGR